MTNKPTWEEIDKYLRLNCSIRMFGLLEQSPDDEITNKDYRYLVSLVLRVLDTKLAEQRQEIIEIITQHYIPGHMVVNPTLEAIVNKINLIKQD
jgi:hypothetical protein